MLLHRVVTHKAGLLGAEVPAVPTVFTCAADPMTLDQRVRAAIVAELGLPDGTAERCRWPTSTAAASSG